MKALRSGGSPLWLDRIEPRAVPSYPSAPRSLDVDVAIVGGGVTGAAVAYALAASGIRVAVLEARRVGRGSTAASTALLMQEPDEDFGDLRRRYGTLATGRIWRRSRLATEQLLRTLARLGIRCNLTRRDSIYYTLDDAAGLRRELAMRHASKVGGQWLGPAALERTTGIRGVGAIRTRGNAQGDPYKVCIGLLDAAEREGAGIFERTRAGRIETSARGVTVQTTRGQLHAEYVVIATGYATRDFKPLLSRFRLSHTYVLATERLSPAIRKRIGLSAVLLWDTGRPYHYARWTPDGRLLLGGGDRPLVRAQARARAFREGVQEVRDHFVHLYPALTEVAIDYTWEGLFGATADGLPYIGPHRRYPRHLFALGYGGNGITFGFLAAQLIRERLLGQVDEDHELFSFARPHALSLRHHTTSQRGQTALS